MITNFKNFIENKLKIDSNNRILLAVSGGADSIAMLHLFSKTGYQCGIAHCNFHLRGNDSDLDESFVKNLAANYQIPFYKTDFETREYALKNGISIEMAARELRYAWFEKIRQENNFHYIATAHHQDDLIETFFINLTRGTGIRGLTGFRQKKDRIIRPMLFTNRETINQFIEEEKLEYRVDVSNSDIKIIRNKFRHVILPALEEMNKAYRQNILQSIENLHDAEILMNSEVIKARTDILERKGEETFINIEKLLEYRTIHPYLYEFLKPFGFNPEQIKDIEMALGSEPGKTFYSDEYQLIKDRNILVIAPLKKKD